MIDKKPVFTSAKAVIVHATDNDLYNKENNIEAVKKNLDDLVKSIKKVAPNAKIYLSAPIARPKLGQTFDGKLNAFTTEMRKICEADSSLVFIEHRELAGSDCYQLFDSYGVHLTPRGMSAFVQNLQMPLRGNVIPVSTAAQSTTSPIRSLTPARPTRPLPQLKSSIMWNGQSQGRPWNQSLPPHVHGMPPNSWFNPWAPPPPPVWAPPPPWAPHPRAY